MTEYSLSWHLSSRHWWPCFFFLFIFRILRKVSGSPLCKPEVNSHVTHMRCSRLVASDSIPQISTEFHCSWNNLVLLASEGKLSKHTNSHCRACPLTLFQLQLASPCCISSVVYSYSQCSARVSESTKTLLKVSPSMTSFCPHVKMRLLLLANLHTSKTRRQEVLCYRASWHVPHECIISIYHATGYPEVVTRHPN